MYPISANKFEPIGQFFLLLQYLYFMELFLDMYANKIIKSNQCKARQY